MNPQIHLASKSSRRQDLLRQIGVEFDVIRLREAPGRERDVQEGARSAEPALHYVERMARTKVAVAWMRMQQRKMIELPVLSADTEVVLDDTIFGKPADAADAARMLRLLSGKTHDVLSAVAVRMGEQTEVEISASKVAFRKLTPAEIDHYVATGEPPRSSRGSRGASPAWSGCRSPRRRKSSRASACRCCRGRPPCATAFLRPRSRRLRPRSTAAP